MLLQVAVFPSNGDLVNGFQSFTIILAKFTDKTHSRGKQMKLTVLLISSLISFSAFSQGIFNPTRPDRCGMVAPKIMTEPGIGGNGGWSADGGFITSVVTIKNEDSIGCTYSSIRLLHSESNRPVPGLVVSGLPTSLYLAGGQSRTFNVRIQSPPGMLQQYIGLIPSLKWTTSRGLLRTTSCPLVREPGVSMRWNYMTGQNPWSQCGMIWYAVVPQGCIARPASVIELNPQPANIPGGGNLNPVRPGDSKTVAYQIKNEDSLECDPYDFGGMPFQYTAPELLDGMYPHLAGAKFAGSFKTLWLRPGETSQVLYKTITTNPVVTDGNGQVLIASVQRPGMPDFTGGGSRGFQINTSAVAGCSKKAPNVQVARSSINTNTTRYVLTVKNMDTGNCGAEVIEAMPSYFESWDVTDPIEPSNLTTKLISQGQSVGPGQTTTITFEVSRNPLVAPSAATSTTPFRIYGTKYGFETILNLGL